MRKIDRIELISTIGRELQKRMTYSDINMYLKGFNIDTTIETSNANSKWIYVKELLAPINDDIIFKIADELEIEHVYEQSTSMKSTDCIFWREGHFKLFLSHVSSFKERTSQLQKSLLPFGISGFVAHEDIIPTKEWQIEIEKALFTMDALVAILMKGFKESNWCDQEVGAALGRDVLIIPIRKGIDPYGFLGKYQGLQTKDKNISEVAEAIFRILIDNNKTREKMISVLISLFLRANNVVDAKHKIDLISSIENIPKKYLDRLKQNSLENELIKKSGILIDRVNQLLLNYDLGKITESIELENESDDNLPF